MCSLDEMTARVKSLNFQQQVEVIFGETDGFLIQEVQSQLSDGYLSTGDDITPAYSNKYYAKKKFALNPAARGNPDIRLTGELYRNMFIELDKENYRIGSSVEYSDKMEEQYGQNLLRASDKSKQAYSATYLYPRMLDYVNRTLLGN